MHIESRAQEFILKNQLVKPGDHILVGVSGGPDSVALLCILNTLKHSLSFSLTVAHYNHRLRKQSDKEQKFVEQMAQRLQVPFVGAIRLKSEKMKGSIEDAARQKRYAFFATASKKYKADCVALAHTQDDLAETVLMRLIRGSGLRGLRAILPKREIYKTHIIRPLLGLTKSELLGYLKSHKISYCIDHTNRQKIFFRNKIRLDLLPYLKKHYNPNIVEVLSQTAGHLALDFEYLDSVVEKVFETLSIKPLKRGHISFKTVAFKKHHLSLQKMVIRKAVEQVFGAPLDLTTKHVAEVEDLLSGRPVGSVVDLPHGVFLRKEKNVLTLGQRAKG